MECVQAGSVSGSSHSAGGLISSVSIVRAHEMPPSWRREKKRQCDITDMR